MKELTIEQKAQRYDEAIERAKEFKNNPFAGYDGADLLSSLFPELKENKEELEDERIRKAIIEFFELQDDNTTYSLVPKKDILAWLEKKGEQKPCMIQWKGDNLKEVINFTGKCDNFNKWFKSFEEYERYVFEHNNIFKLFNADGSHYEIPVGAWIVKTPDGYNVASNAVLKQKPADKVEPKFKVGDTVKDPYGDLYHITEITDDSYKTDDGRFILFKNQEVYTLSNFTAWSKEDEKVKESIIIGLEMLKDGASDQSLIALYNKKIDWLKSLKDRYTWKPSDEQVEALEKECIAHSNYELCRLLEQLKKLKG